NRPAQLLDVVEGRDSKAPSLWLEARPNGWRDAIRWGVMDLSGPYRKVFTTTLPTAVQVADPFHVVKLANERVDECRRRVQNETLGHRGRKDDPLYKGRRLLTKGHERLDERGNDKLMGLLEAGDPKGEVRMTWYATETLRGFYAIDGPADAAVFLDELIDDMTDESMPREVRSLARTLTRWRAQILAWHQARVSNGPTEATNNLIKRIKRVGFGFRKFASYRVRVLLYAGKPNWDLLDTIAPR
ncbi:MAG: ISL3 family transposase, partial [Actinobacteria bacterium]|nr:ISL3 family transposase [Actinomycetota bacterium]